MSAKETLLQYFENETLSGKTFTEIAKFLKVSHREKKSLLALLDSLCDEGALYVARRSSSASSKAPFRATNAALRFSSPKTRLSTATIFLFRIKICTARCTAIPYMPNGFTAEATTKRRW